jgi:excisionase family DNA binding protein
MSNSPSILSYLAAAAKLGVSQQTVRRLVARGELRTVHVGKRRVFIVGEDIEKMMKPATRMRCVMRTGR